MDTGARDQLLDSLIREHQGRLRAFVYAQAWDRDIVDDLVQDVYVIAYHKLESLETPKAAWPWLKTIARNILRQHWRTVQRDTSKNQVLAALAQLRVEPDASEDSEAAERVLWNLRQCVDKLSEKARSLLKLVYVDKRKSDEIAKEWGATGVVVRVYLHRLRTSLRSCVDAAGRTE
jgi:RNA polymerase sigma-70 factor (ECF subfamily)